ncbi:MAG: hypothetical protein ACEQR8_06875 [Cypionkella sp.]
MQRTIVAPAELPAAALAELKQWLAIRTTADDAALAGVLRAALDTCEAFTGALPLAATCEEVLPASGAWQALATRPVSAIVGLAAIPAERPRFALPPDGYAIDIDAAGRGWVRVLRQGAAGRVAVRFSAGLAPGWELLPEAIRHGLVRLAAHHWRAREDGAEPAPPAAVAALWRPWREVRL